MGIDLNPQFIGYSIIKGSKVIYSKTYDIGEIITKVKQTKEQSSSKTNKYLNNKFNHETIEITKDIVNTCLKYKVSNIFMESLDFTKSLKFKYKGLNRLCQNL